MKQTNTSEVRIDCKGILPALHRALPSIIAAPVALVVLAVILFLSCMGDSDALTQNKFFSNLIRPYCPVVVYPNEKTLHWTGTQWSLAKSVDGQWFDWALNKVVKDPKFLSTTSWCNSSGLPIVNHDGRWVSGVKNDPMTLFDLTHRRGAVLKINGKSTPLMWNDNHWSDRNGKTVTLSKSQKITATKPDVGEEWTGSNQDPEVNAKKEVDSFLTSCVLLSVVAFGFLLAARESSLFSPFIRLSADLIYFPVTFYASTNGRLKRLWSDVSAIVFSQDVLTLIFRSGGKASIDLRKVPVEQVEQLCLIVEMRAQAAAKECPALRAFLDATHDAKHSSGEVSYTQIWQDGMNQRFSSVAFIPLEPDHTMQTRSIKILRQLSFGGLAAVYLAENGPGNIVVLKESSAPYGAAGELVAKAQELLDREAQLLSRIDHPRIVRVEDHFRENGRSYLVMTYVAAENLRQYVKKNGPVDEHTAVRWILQMVESVRYLHHLDPPIIHRDITPDNIVLDKDGQLVLIDFGAANEFMATVTGTMIGKQGYVPPEQFKGKANKQSDIFAVGCTLHFLLTGIDPDPLTESHPRSINQALSESLDVVVASCTALELSERISTIDELASRLKDLQPGGTINVASMDREKIAGERIVGDTRAK